MAGVVAMASVIEDFDTKPCKKTCKDVDSPMVKTITSYFSPVPKPAEKPFSPPRSNNIMDYFNRKDPSPKTRMQSPNNQAKENSQVSKQTTPVVPKQPAAKRSRKTSKTARKLVQAAEESSCIVIGETDEVTGTCGILGSDTAVLLKQICAETSASSVTSDNKNVESAKHKKVSVVKSNHLNTVDLSPILPPKDKPKRAKAPIGNSKKRQKLENKFPEPKVEEMKPLEDISMEVNVGDASQLNNSTVTISFEDFVRSQDTSNNDICDEPESEVANNPITENPASESNLQVSPRMVTIKAEVHTVSPKEKVRRSRKVASRVTKEEDTCTTQMAATQTESNLQTTSKWKSNVVLQEEDVELCVLESSSTPKCSQAERKQFMAAFKQPSLDGTKNKPNKTQSKQKQSGDNTADASEKDDEDDPKIQSITGEEQGTSASSDKSKKKTSKEIKKATEKQETSSTETTVPGENTVVIDVDIDNNKEDEPTASTPSVPAVRRSTRAALAKQTSIISVTESPPKSSSKQDFAKGSPSTKRKSKHGVFRAEMLSPPDEMESPIRIRFRRVGSRNPEDQAFSTTKNTRNSKKTKQAKKLLEKAKAMKQNKKVSTEEKTLRRSSRTEASIKRSYCENEDSIICVEDGPKTTPEKSKSKKALRSLNDVLGKAAPNKETASVSQDKAPRKPLPVSIFDDSSREASENSQDDEQFRARREFLKSGLPESFKKQMAKTAAVKEAYATAGSSFQPVVHISQATDDCPLWSLPWPQSAFVNHLKEIIFKFSDICVENKNELLKEKTQAVQRLIAEKVSGRRPEMTAVVREELLKQISGSNPAFPVQKFMSHFLKKQKDLIQQCAAAEPSSVSEALCSDSAAEAIGGKRKRVDEESEAVKVAKKQRRGRSGEKLSTQPAEGAPAKRGGRPRRGAKSLSKEDGVKTEASQSEDKSVIVLDDSPGGTKAEKPDVLIEDTLWTEKYQPQHSSEVIGNTALVRRLHSWLKEWKLRADKEDKRKQKDQKQEEGSIDSDWECGEEDSWGAEDLLCNTMLITGPPGVGKTATVYACAQELGFKVFEVNSSSQRSGRLILSQLKEATQSHQVDSQGVNAHKPTYFNSYSAGRPGSSPRKVNSPRRAVSSPRKPPQSPRGTKRGSLAPTALANFFKMTKPANKEQPNTKEEQTATSKKKTADAQSKKTSLKSPPDALSKGANPEEPSKKTPTSLILFEEVDVIFDDDLGFLSAIKTFMTTTKRPVILTTSDPAFSAMFDGSFEEIIFESPSLVDVSSYLQLLCLAEDLRTDVKDIQALLSLNSCDVRKTLLQLQFWTRSGGGRHKPTPLADRGPNEELQQKTESADVEMKDPAPLPVCDTGCTESALGLLNIAPQQNMWELLKKQDADCSKLVTLSRRQGVDLLYANMETLLPLPLTTLTTSNHKQQQPKNLPSHAKVLQTDEDGSEDASPVKVSNRMKKNRRKHCQPEQGSLESDSDSEDGFQSIKQQQNSPKVKAIVDLVPKVMKKPLSREELTTSVPVSQCLQSLADFMDDMSFLDLFSSEERSLSDVKAAVMKDGLTDEARVDTERRSGPLLECFSEIGAQVQSLSFNKCHRSVGDAWLKAQQLEGERKEEATAQLTLPVVAHNKGCSFTKHELCHPHVVERRRAVMDDLEDKGVFGSMVSRAAAAQDYLPALRTICKCEQLKEQGKVKRRFLHYLDSVHLGLQKSTLELLAEDFP